MSLRGRVIQGAASLGVGQVLSQGLAFLRNVFVARLISPEDFGIAATFAITVSLFEMLSDLAVDKLIIQAPDGDDPKLQANAQSLQALRGLLCGMLTTAIAWPLAILFNTPDALWAYLLLGLVPMLRGFTHLDAGRLQREMCFLPSIMTQVGSQALATAVAWPLARWIGDYSAMLWVVLIQAATLVLLSHAVARRPYVWSWDSNHLRRLWAFGWPLLINGTLMFGIFQGDRLLVGSFFTMTELGHYTVAVSVAFAPTMLLGSLSLSLLLPLLAQVQSDPSRLTYRYLLSVQLLSASSGLIAALFLLLGPPLLTLFFGSAYADGADLLSILALMQAIRLFRFPPTVAALARGDTHNSMIANLARLVGLPIALLVAQQGAHLEWIAWAGVMGEFLALTVALLRLKRVQGQRLSPAMTPLLAVCGGLALLFGVTMKSDLSAAVRVTLCIVAVAATILFMAMMKESRIEGFRLVHGLFHRLLPAARQLT